MGTFYLRQNPSHSVLRGGDYLKWDAFVAVDMSDLRFASPVLTMGAKELEIEISVDDAKTDTPVASPRKDVNMPDVTETLELPTVTLTLEMLGEDED